MRPSALIFKIHGCHATTVQVQVNKMLDSQEGTQVINCYRGQKVKGHKLCLMVYFSDVISAKMTKISFLVYKGCLFFSKNI